MGAEYFNYHCPAEFELRPAESMLFWKLYAESADEEHRSMIAEARGVRFSPLNKRPSWQGALSSPGEPMHMILLGRLLRKTYSSN